MENLKNARRHFKWGKSLLVIMITVLLCSCSKAKNYDEIARQFAQYDFDAVMPKLCYADPHMAILYDQHGIVVFDLGEQKITGFASFEGIDLSLQGSDPTFVRVSQEGKYVYVFSGENADGEKYLYDVSKDVFGQVDRYDDQFEQSVIEPKIYEGAIDQAGEAIGMRKIFQYEEKGYCYLTVEQSENAEKVNYSNLRLVVNENGASESKEYVIFE